MLEESEDVQFEVNPKTMMYTLHLLNDITYKAGTIKVVAKNGGGEDSCSSTLKIGGRAPEFIEKPLKCTVLAGRYSMMIYRLFLLMYVKLEKLSSFHI